MDTTYAPTILQYKIHYLTVQNSLTGPAFRKKHNRFILKMSYITIQYFLLFLKKMFTN